MAMALELGSEVSTVFDETVTLLVCGQIVRNEKVLCSIVKGVPVVDVDYVLDSHKASKWLEVRFGILASCEFIISPRCTILFKMILKTGPVLIRKNVETSNYLEAETLPGL